jgi:hypothetical protein
LALKYFICIKLLESNKNNDLTKLNYNCTSITDLHNVVKYLREWSFSCFLDQWWTRRRTCWLSFLSGNAAQWLFVSITFIRCEFLKGEVVNSDNLYAIRPTKVQCKKRWLYELTSKRSEKHQINRYFQKSGTFKKEVVG